MVAGKLAKMPQGRPSEKAANLPDIAQPKAAELLNVSERSLRSAKQVQATGTPELQEAVEAGKVSVSAAADIASKPEPEQRLIDILDSSPNIRNKISRGKFTAVFLLQCLTAIGVNEIRL